MSTTKKPSGFPYTSEKGSTGYALGLQGSSFAKIQFPVLLAKMLMPFANVFVVNPGTYTREAWMSYATAPSYWYSQSAQVGDVLLISSVTSDTNQKLLYFFLVTAIRTGSAYKDGHCILMLMEGEPPLWPDTST